MQTDYLTNRQARRFLLSHQGLGSEYAFTGKNGVLEYIKRVGCIQYDPLNIVGRNPELVLQSRFVDFRPSLLQELLYFDRMLIDGMDKVMSIYSAEDWPYFHRFRKEALARYSSIETLQEVIPKVREAIETRGPLSSADLDFNQTVDWAWAPTRMARAVLESMYFWGELIVHHKKNNQKVYDLAYRHFPQKLLYAKDPNETDKQYLDWRVLRRIGAIGFLWEKAGDGWIGISGLKSKERQQSFKRLWEENRLVQLHIEGGSAPFYARTEDYLRVSEEKAYLDPNHAPRAMILAPLDNLLWDRRMIRHIFAFDYTWEVYKPVDKRNYGYYVLPILYGDTFVARFEPGRDKATGRLQIKNWWWEHGIVPSSEMIAELKSCFEKFIQYLGTVGVEIDRDLAKRTGIEWLVP